MATLIHEGWLAGNAILRARKAYRCDYWRGRTSGGFCRKPINPGDHYAEGEGNGETTRNGRMLRDRYCLECAKVDAKGNLVCEAA